MRRAASSATACGAAASSSQGWPVPLGASGATSTNGRALPVFTAEATPSNTSGRSSSAVRPAVPECTTITGKRAAPSCPYSAGSHTRTARGRPSGPGTWPCSSSPPAGRATLPNSTAGGADDAGDAGAGSGGAAGTGCSAPTAATACRAAPRPGRSPSSTATPSALTHVRQSAAAPARTSTGRASAASSYVCAARRSRQRSIADRADQLPATAATSNNRTRSDRGMGTHHLGEGRPDASA